MIQQHDKVHIMQYLPHDQERDEPNHDKLYVARNYHTDPYEGTWCNKDYELKQENQTGLSILWKLQSTQSFRTSPTEKSV